MSVAETAFAELMRLAGRERPDFVHIQSGSPALKTRYFAQEMAAAAIAAGATVAADIWTDRGGTSQSIVVDEREAAAALVSFQHQSFADKARAPNLDRPGAGRMTPANGFFATRDGRRIYLHPSFPPSAAKLHELMGSPADRDAAAKAALGWDALDLENAIAERGICGAMVRTPEEWDACEQGRVLAARPVVEVVRIGDSPPEPLPSGAEAPLSGVRALDLTRVLAGPTCARTLAQYGADVLYIASPALPAVPMFVSDTNHGKLSAWLDLATEEGRARLKELVRGADVFSQGYRAGALERLGFGPLELANLRPGLICTAINAYGHEGPWRARPGWEQLAQTVTGVAFQHGADVDDNGEPTLLPAAVTDYTTGFLAAFGTMLALHRRARWGGSYLVTVSLSQTGMWLRRLGHAGPERLDALQPLAPEEVDRWRVDVESGYGPLRHLRPPVTMSATPARWRRPVTPLGAHPAAWPDAA